MNSLNKVALLIAAIFLLGPQKAHAQKDCSDPNLSAFDRLDLDCDFKAAEQKIENEKKKVPLLPATKLSINASLDRYSIRKLMDAQKLEFSELAGESLELGSVTQWSLKMDRFEEICLGDPLKGEEGLKGIARIKAIRDAKRVCDSLKQAVNLELQNLEPVEGPGAEALSECVGPLKRPGEFEDREGKIDRKAWMAHQDFAYDWKTKVCVMRAKQKKFARGGFEHGEYLNLSCNENTDCGMLVCHEDACRVCVQKQTQESCSADFDSSPENRKLALAFVAKIEEVGIPVRQLPVEEFDFLKGESSMKANLNSGFKNNFCSKRQKSKRYSKRGSEGQEGTYFQESYGGVLVNGVYQQDQSTGRSNERGTGRSQKSETINKAYLISRETRKNHREFAADSPLLAFYANYSCPASFSGMRQQAR